MRDCELRRNEVNVLESKMLKKETMYESIIKASRPARGHYRGAKIRPLATKVIVVQSGTVRFNLA